MIRKLLLLIAIISLKITSAQIIEVKGKFLSDSVKVGEHISFSLSTIADKKTQLLYPSKDFDFSPFEFVEKEVFPTTTLDSSQVIDSAIYVLRTFEMDSALVLQLPVYKITKKGDSISYLHEPDNIALKRIIPSPPKQIEVKEQADFVEIPKRTNWPFWITLLTLIGILLAVVLIITGKPILRYFAIRKTTKRHHKFLTEFDQTVRKLIHEEPSFSVDTLVQLWKNHTGFLSKRPFKSYTTKDFKNRYPNQKELIDSLSTIDSIIYGGKSVQQLDNSAESLKAFANKLFEERIAQIKNG